MKKIKILCLILFSVGVLYSSAPPGEPGGIIQRAADVGAIKSADAQTFQASIVPTSPTKISEIISVYAPYASQKATDLVSAIQSGKFPNTLSDRLLLTESLFAQLFLHMGLSVAVNADISSAQKINDPLSKETTPPQLALPDVFATLLKSTHFARGVLQGSSQVPSRHIDKFAGVILINGGFFFANDNWQGTTLYAGVQNNDKTRPFQATTAPTSAPQTSSGGVAGVPITAAFVASLGGVDQWPQGQQLLMSSTPDTSEKVRSMVIVPKNVAGATIPTYPLGKPADPTGPTYLLEVREQTGTVEPLIQISQGEQYQIVDAPSTANFFSHHEDFPWAIVVMLQNFSQSDGTQDSTIQYEYESGVSVLPQLRVMGLVRLNPIDFPLYFNGAANAATGELAQNFSTADLLSAASKTYINIAALPKTPTDVLSADISKFLGQCSQPNGWSFSCVGRSGKGPSPSPTDYMGESQQSTQNFAQAKFDGILLNGNQTKSLFNALKGTQAILKQVFVTKNLLIVPKPSTGAENTSPPGIYTLFEEPTSPQAGIDYNYQTNVVPGFISATENYVPAFSVELGAWTTDEAVLEHGGSTHE